MVDRTRVTRVSLSPLLTYGHRHVTCHLLDPLSDTAAPLRGASDAVGLEERVQEGVVPSAEPGQENCFLDDRFWGDWGGGGFRGGGRGGWGGLWGGVWVGGLVCFGGEKRGEAMYKGSYVNTGLAELCRDSLIGAIHYSNKGGGGATADSSLQVPCFNRRPSASPARCNKHSADQKGFKQ